MISNNLQSLLYCLLNKKFFTLLTIIIFIISCSNIEKIKEEHALENIISEYNRLLIEANKTRNLEPLKKIADESVVKKLELWMAAWEDGNASMDTELKSLNFDSIKITGNNARVKTTEDWSFEYRDLDTKKILSPKESIHYEMEYILVKKEGRWLITKINILKEAHRGREWVKDNF